MVKIEDRLGELVGGEFKIRLKDDTELILKPTLGHKRKLLFNYKQVSEKDGKGLTVELHDEQNNILHDILSSSYPKFTKDQIEKIMLHYDNEILMELYMCWGWIDRKAMEAMQKHKSDQIKKLMGDVENPEIKPQD